MEEFTSELIRLAAHEARTPEGRKRVAHLLRETLAIVEPEPRSVETAPPLPPPQQSADAFVSARVANAFDGMAAALSLAADHAACIADQAKVIAQPPRHQAVRPVPGA